MNRIISWLNADLSVAQCLVLAIRTVLALVAFGLVAAFILALLGVQATAAWISDFMVKDDVLVVVGSFILAAPIEELGFRLLPAVVYWCCTGRINTENRIAGLVALMLVSSLIFGWMHGGIMTILTIGPIGFFFAIVFMRCGGCRGRLFRGFVFSSIVHVTYNLSLLFFIRAIME